jgi:hypothetical protein
MVSMAANVSYASTSSIPVNATNAQPEGSSITPLGNGAINFSSDLQLATVNVVSGGIVATPVNFSVTSTLPLTTPSAAALPSYDANQLLLPTGGIANLFVSGSTVNATSPASTAGAPYGRQELADRIYFGRSSAVTAPGPELFLTNGLGVKAINRSPAAQTGSLSDDVGVSGSIYVGIGVDGGPSTTSGVGNFKVEAFVAASEADSFTMHTFFPGVNTRNFVPGVGGSFQFAVNNFSVAVQGGWPLGSESHYLRKSLVFSLAMSR